MKITTFLMTALLVTACSGARADTNVLDQVVLLDVQGLWGGTDLWIPETGKAVCRFVKPPAKGEIGLHEIRYEFELSKKQQASLCELVEKHDFFGIKTSDRLGFPDESRPAIFIKTGDRTHAAGKWASDDHKDFDPLYAFLLTIAESGKNGTEIKKGSYDRNWNPEGFPSNKNIREMTSPKPDKP